MNRQYDTDNLIEVLCKDNKAVHCLCPNRYALLWLFVAVPLALLFVGWWYGFRADIDAASANVMWDLRVFFALATGMTAGFAAFWTGIPGIDKRYLAIPFVFLLLWLLAIVLSVFLDPAMPLGRDIYTYYHSPQCFKGMSQYGLPLAFVMYLFLRRFRTTTPILTAGLMGLAVFAFSAGIWELHSHGATPFVQLFWHFGTVIVYTTIFALIGRVLFRW